MTDAETTAAVDALARRLRERDTAMRDGTDYADAEVFAAEYIAALRARGGWRPTEARAVPAWNRHPVAGSGPTADYRAARAALEEKLARREDEEGAA